MANDLSKVVALADLGEAILAAVKESGLLKPRKRRRTVTVAKEPKQAAAKTAIPVKPRQPKRSKQPVQRGEGVLGQLDEEE